MVWCGVVWYDMIWYVCMYVCIYIYIYMIMQCVLHAIHVTENGRFKLCMETIIKKLAN